MVAIDVLLAGPIPPALEARLVAAYRVHLTPIPQVRAIVGGGSIQVDAALIAALPRLEIVAIHGVGLDGIDLDTARHADASPS